MVMVVGRDYAKNHDFFFFFSNVSFSGRLSD